MELLARFTALSAAFVASLVGAPSAAASPEGEVCRSMASVGVRGDCAHLTVLARDVCAQYDRGLDATAVAERLDLTTKDQVVSNFIVAGAGLYFCPDHDEA